MKFFARFLVKILAGSLRRFEFKDLFLGLKFLPFVGFSDKFGVDDSQFLQMLGFLFVFALNVGFCQFLERFQG